jgi:hypothetical protein
MLYGIKDGTTTTIIAAADSVAELEAFFAAARDANTNYEDLIQPGLIEWMSDDRYSRYKKPPYVAEHSSSEQRELFIAEYNITILKPNALVSKHTAMLETLKVDPYAADYNDERTLEEILGIKDEDPWDTRTEEEKAADLERQQKYKELADEAKAKGNLSGESFSVPQDSDINITDARVTQNADGSYDYDLLAVKGLHATNDEDLKEVVEATARGERVAKVKKDEGTEGLLDPKEPDGTFFKFDVLMADLAHIKAHGLFDDPIFKANTAIGNQGVGCWFAFKRRVHANSFQKTVKDAGFGAEAVYGCDAYGERLLQKGIQGARVVDVSEEAEIGPRPWNDRAVELEKMTDEEKVENWKTVKGKEFILCGEYEGPDLGCVVYIVPRQHWEKHRTLFSGPLDIGHILPDDMKEKFPGTYQSKARTWNSLSRDLATRGFTESYGLQLYLNNN